MAEAADYEQTAANVNMIDASYKEEPATLDMADVFSEVLEAKKLKYSDISGIVEGGEARKAEAVQETQQQTQPQEMKQIQRPETQTQQQQTQPQQTQIQPVVEQQTKQPEVQTQQQQPTAEPVPPQVQVPKRAIEADMKQAANRLMGMVGGAGKDFEEMVEKDIEQARESGLIMPKLSLQDQVSDLEKMQEGIAEGLFDREQIRIIEKEIKALDRIASREDAGKLAADQKELSALRNQKIKEIKSGLNIK